MIENIRVVLFDHDDTLVGTKEAKWAEHKYVAETYYGKRLSDDEIRLHWGKPLSELVCLLYETDNVEQAFAYNLLCHENFPKTLFPDSVKVLEQLKALGKLTGVITATSRFSFEYDITSLRIPVTLIDYSQTEDDTPFHKPDPRVFEPAKAWLVDRQIKNGEVLYIGDGLHDMKAALDAGFNFIGVESGLVTANQFQEYGVTSLSGVGGLLSFF